LPKVPSPDRFFTHRCRKDTLALAQRGELEEAVELVERKSRHLANRGWEDPRLADAGIELSELLRWYETRSGLHEQSPEAYARRLGFPSARVFLRELLGQYLYAERGRISEPT